MTTAIERITADIAGRIYDQRESKVRFADRDQLKAKAREQAEKHVADMRGGIEPLVEAIEILDDESSLDNSLRRTHIAKVVDDLESGRYTTRTVMAKKFWQELAEELSQKLRAILSMRLTQLIEPDVDPPSCDSSIHTMTTGYSFNINGMSVRVYKAASRINSHWTGSGADGVYPDQKSRSHSWSQRSIRLYSTYELALKAARAKLAWEVAAKLAAIDAEIAEQQRKRSEWTLSNAQSQET